MRVGCKAVVAELDLAAEEDALRGILTRFVPHATARLDVCVCVCVCGVRVCVRVVCMLFVCCMVCACVLCCVCAYIVCAYLRVFIQHCLSVYVYVCMYVCMYVSIDSLGRAGQGAGPLHEPAMPLW